MDCGLHKKICCICATDDRQQIDDLLMQVFENVHLRIDRLNKKESVVQYDYVIYVHTKHSSNDCCLQEQLNEAYKLNKTFIPIIIERNFFRRFFLKAKYSGPNLRTKFLMLCKERGMISFYTIVMSYSGMTIVGDPYGVIYSVITDIGCRIIRKGIVIAETEKNIRKEITLMRSRQRLRIQSKKQNGVYRDVVIDASEEKLGTKKDITIRLTNDIKIVSTQDCDLYKENELLSHLSKGKEYSITLLQGNSRLKFVFKNINRYITFEVVPDSCQNVFFRYPYKPELIRNMDVFRQLETKY